MTADPIGQAREFLQTTQNQDGGWGYRPGSGSVTEPTALAVMTRPSEASWEGGLAWLLRTQRDDGGWGVNAQDDASNWLTGWATWALLLAATKEAKPAARRGLDWLLQVPALRITDSDAISDVFGILGVDPTLSGWPWQPAGASFVEPTALGIFALVAAGLDEHTRLLEALSYLRDRVCQGGGWNVGNPFMFDKVLPPTPYNTALALSSLWAAGVGADDPVISGGLDRLRTMTAQPMMAGSVAWSWIAFQVWGREAPALGSRLSEMQADDGSWDRSPYATASALLALRGPETIISGG